MYFLPLIFSSTLIYPNCTPPPQRVDISIHQNISQLQPWDIGVIGALGNSGTAAFGANSTGPAFEISQYKEYRGQSFSTGSEDNIITLANILRQYQKIDSNTTKRESLIGTSQGSSAVRRCWFGFCPPNEFQYSSSDGLNVAISGANVSALHRQSGYFLSTYNNLTQTSSMGSKMNNTWKLVTLFIGFNNICSEPCDNVNLSNENSVEYYRQQVTETLETFRKSIQHIIFILIQLPPISDYEAWISAKGGDYCSAGSKFLRRHACPCLASESGRQTIKSRVAAFNNALVNITNDYYEKDLPKYNDFGVILWEGLANIKNITDSLPIELVSKLDCLHPSTLGHEAIATSLWNDIFVNGNKQNETSAFNMNLQPLCFNESSYIPFKPIQSP